MVLETLRYARKTFEENTKKVCYTIYKFVFCVILKQIIFTYALSVFCVSAFAQPQTNNWFFASRNGLNFSSGNPVNIVGGQISVMEGASAISDSNGQLIFYSDGINVFNKNHVRMPFGYGLAGGYGSSTQSCIIVPKTIDGTQYYIFTADEEGGSRGFRYSVIDMTLDGGNGDVITKNVPLLTPVCEKITAVLHCNRRDYWVITHRYGSDAYYTYLASDTGVNIVPVISHTGSFIPITYATMGGALKASPDGKKLVAAHGDIGIELADFNNQTGVVSNATGIYNNSIPGIPYGVEFSSNSSLVYVSVTHYWEPADFKRYSGVFQFDISLPTIPAIINSRVQLVKYVSGNEMGGLARGPDGKIYMAQYQKPYLSVINSPNTYGLGCNFVSTGFDLPSESRFSVPNFVNKFRTTDSFTVGSGNCVNIPVAFNYIPVGNLISILWNFDDLSSGAQNFSTLSNPLHNFSAEGIYNISLIKYGTCGNDTLTRQIMVGDVSVNLGIDTGFCEHSSLLLNPNSAGSNTYVWQDGSTSPTYAALTAGLYWVQVSSNSNGCVKRDSIILIPKRSPLVDLGKDTILCEGQTMVLDAQNAGSEYTWQDNSTMQTFHVNQNGTYWVTVTIDGCTGKDTITVFNDTKPQFSLGLDQYLCAGHSLQLVPGISGASYIWQDGSTNSTYLVTAGGLYYVDIRNSCGATKDSINIINGNCEVYIPSAFTPNNDGLNDYFRVGGTTLVTEFSMQIFDRYGHMIFVTRDKNAGWDGRFKNKDLPAGGYVYVVNYKKTNSSKAELVQGTVILLR